MMDHLIFFSVLMFTVNGVLISTCALADDYSSRECDCTEITGACAGAITDVQNITNADFQHTTTTLFKVHSSSEQCSKVEYYIDNTPYQSIFTGGITSESSFGLKRSSNVEYRFCRICKTKSSKETNVDVDALIELAKKTSNRHLAAINRKAYDDMSLANSTYSSALQNISNQTTSSNNRSPNSIAYNAPHLSQDVISKVNCQGDYSALSLMPEFKPYQDIQLDQQRKAVLSENVQKMLAGAKVNGSQKAALHELQDTINEYDRAASEAASNSSQLWGGTGEDLASLFNSNRLPTNISCSESDPYGMICAALAYKWGSLGSQYSMAIIKKCW